MAEKWTKLTISEKVFNKIMIDCKQEFLKVNPSFKELKISQNFLINRIANYYLGKVQ